MKMAAVAQTLPSRMYKEGRWSTREVGSGEIKGEKNGGKCLIEPVQSTN